MDSRQVQVLVADDDPSMVTAIGYVLEKEHIPYIAASDGKETLDKFWKHRPSIVLLDIMMPEIDGYAICRAIKENPDTKDTHVVLVSARGQAADVARDRRSSRPAAS